MPATSCYDQKHLECMENMYVHVCAEHRQGEKQSHLIIKKVLEAIKYCLYSSTWVFFSYSRRLFTPVLTNLSSLLQITAIYYYKVMVLKFKML